MLEIIMTHFEDELRKVKKIGSIHQSYSIKPEELSKFENYVKTECSHETHDI